MSTTRQIVLLTPRPRETLMSSRDNGETTFVIRSFRGVTLPVLELVLETDNAGDAGREFDLLD